MYVAIPKSAMRRMSRAILIRVGPGENANSILCCHHLRMMLAAGGIQRELFAKFQYLPTDTLQRRSVRAIVKGLSNPMADLLHLGFLHSAGGHGWRSDANAAWLHW